MPRAPRGCSVGLEDLQYEELLEYAQGAEKHIEELDERIAWMTMRGTDELPRMDSNGHIIAAPTGEALVEYLRAQRRAERERAEKAEQRVAKLLSERDAGLDNAISSGVCESCKENSVRVADEMHERAEKAEHDRDKAIDCSSTQPSQSNYTSCGTCQACRQRAVDALVRERDEARAAVQTWSDDYQKLAAECATAQHDLRKLAGDDNLPASSAAVVAMARIQTLEREVAAHAEWAKQFTTDPKNATVVGIMRENVELKAEVERLKGEAWQRLKP